MWCVTDHNNFVHSFTSDSVNNLCVFVINSVGVKIQNPNPYRYSHHFSETHVNLRLFLTRLTCHYHLTKQVPIFHTRTSTYFILIYKPYWYKSCKTVQTRSKGGWRRWWLYQAWGISFCKMNRNMILKVDLRVTSYYEMRGYYPICTLLNNAKVFFMLVKMSE